MNPENFIFVYGDWIRIGAIDRVRVATFGEDPGWWAAVYLRNGDIVRKRFDDRATAELEVRDIVRGIAKLADAPCGEGGDQ